MNTGFKALTKIALDSPDQFSKSAAMIRHALNFFRTKLTVLAAKATTYTMVAVSSRFFFNIEKAAGSSLLGGNAPSYFDCAGSVVVLGM